MYVLQLRLRVIPVPNWPSTSERNVACVSEPQAIFTRKMNSIYQKLIAFQKCDGHTCTIESRNYAPLFCMIALGKSGDGGLYIES